MSVGTATRPHQVFWQLSRPKAAADRRRAFRMSAGVAGSGVFLLAALALLSIDGNPNAAMSCDPTNCVPQAPSETPYQPGLADYVTQPDLRAGTTFGALLLVVPFILLALQALRTGTAARERRLAALSLAGATRGDLRRLALMEGTRAAVVGALAAGPGYILLWLLLGPAMPNNAKLLPQPGLPVILGWLGLVLVLGSAGGLIAQLTARPATVSPLGLTRRRPRPLARFDALVPVVSLIVIVACFIGPLGYQDYMLMIVFAAVMTLSVTGGPWLILLTARIASRRQGLLTSLAARRLLADVRTPGRGVGVMLAVGVTFGVLPVLVANVITQVNREDYGFYLYGSGGAAIAALLAAVVATSSLVVGATEQVLENARATAVFVALAASPNMVSKIVRRQLMLAAVPPTMIGAVLGWAAYVLLLRNEGQNIVWIVATLPVALGSAALAAVLGALIATMAVGPAIRSSSGPENLRTP
ncbi:hypothetical protein Kisp01_04750 [Kineosporia sp. NBRC 101677]|uniref:FtsX-like permease family protein n=1 Tax=Kineosporia sp. NBRC 101677 TaxID=3032197 RepID=UPI0024A35A80|nr:FtsX-like permease family protein [Kineosporia sp. NBRC 101677]GLY13459.1 hypothetical protein Kisp01_04750 [Kineosporia sp. NBRC 101677]